MWDKGITIDLSKGIHIALFNLILVALIGCFLRYVLLNPVQGVNYSYIIHAHSHLAFLGWVFMALFILIIHVFLPSAIFIKGGRYAILFILLQTANMGMLFTFPIMGYALWSIVFSASHALLAILFAWMIIKDVTQNLSVVHSVSFSSLKWALILMIVSNLAPFALGPVSVTQGKTDLYYLLIYFYLHFQYNGWFTFAVFGLIFRLLENNGINTNVRLIKMGFILKLIAIFPAFILSSLWTEPGLIWHIIGAISAATQLVGLLFLLYFLINKKEILSLIKIPILRVLFWVGISAVLSQHVLMLLSAVPDISNTTYSRNTVIAFLHLVLLGFITVWLFLLLYKIRLMILNSLSRIGLRIFLIAFTGTECLLVFESQIHDTSKWLFYLAIAQLVGIILIAVNVEKMRYPT